MASSCGFHLRDQQTIPTALQTLSLECNNSQNWPLCQSLRNQLHSQGITLSNDAPLVLAILHSDSDQRVLSLQKDASAAEYGLTLTVLYQLLDAKTRQTLSKQSLSADRSYQNHPSASLAKERESDEISSELNRRLATMIIRQIRVFDQQRIDETLLRLAKEP